MFAEQEIIFGMKTQSAAGTPATITATEAAHIGFNLSIIPDGNQNDRGGALIGQGGQLASVPGWRSGTAHIEIELAGSGSGTVPPWASQLFPVCHGVFTSNSCAFGIRTETYLTLKGFYGGKLCQLSDAQGTFTLMNGTAGNIPRLAFDLVGRYDEPTDAANLSSITYPTVRPPRVGNATMTIGGYAGKWREINLALNGQLQLRPNGSSDTGLYAGNCMNVNPTFGLLIEDDLTVNRDWDGIQKNGTLETLSLVLGSAGNRITIGSTTAQTVNHPVEYVEGVRCRRIAGAFRAPGNVFTIAFD